MSDEKLRTQRGFRIFLAGVEQRGGTVSLVESSMAFEGAHCLLYEEDPSGALTHVLLDVSGAKAVRDALDIFIREAEAGELTEPATRESEE